MSNPYTSAGFGGVSDRLGSRPAVLVVDMQLGLTNPKLSLGGLPMIHSAADHNAELLALARANHIPIAKCRTAYGSVADMPRWKNPAVREEFI